MARFIFFAFFLLGALPAIAQEMPFAEQPRCWLGSMSYSPGATARAGNAVMLCGEDFIWVETADWAAGCLYEGRFYGVGSTEQNSAQRPETECQPDGTWSRVAE